MIVGEERERERKRERRILFIILLDSLYYFIRLYVKIKIRRLGVLLDGLVKKIK